MCRYCFDKNIKLPTNYTVAINKKIAEELGLNQEHCTNSEYEIANQNCIYPVKNIKIKSKEGHDAWDLEAFSFFESEKVPDTVNPSLWLNGKSNSKAGVFEVVKNAIYQVRGFDIANLTIIRSKTGWIVQDVMTSAETSHAALELLEKALNEEVISKIRAIIISHSHADHFGGIRGVVSPELVGKAEDGKIPIYVPAGFDIECVKENIFAGTAMSRRSSYQFGFDLQSGPTGLVSTGLGLASAKGEVTFITPTDYIEENKTEIIDGIKVEFQLTPGTEAPSEMNNYFPDYKALWLAENCCGTLHNLYPIRGAQLRDSSAWTDYILEAMVKYADKSDVIFQSHNWPHYNTAKNPNTIKEYLLGNAAIYKYTHDQTLLYANQGYTAKEIARKLSIPEALKFNWYARPYYGSLPINSRAVYTKYLGFFTGNPNDIDPLTELEAAKAFIEYVGSEEEVLNKAIKHYEEGDYRKCSYAVGKVVLANSDNQKARLLCADAFEQLGYIAESSVWRNAYLQGALELRHGIKKKASKPLKNNDLKQCMSVDLMLKYLGIIIDSAEVKNEEFSIRLNISDEGKQHSYVAKLYGGVLLTYIDDAADIKQYATFSKEELFALLEKQLDSVKDKIETNSFELLKKLESYIVLFGEKSNFEMIASNEK